MKRLLWILPLCAVLGFVAGCVTQRDKVAVARTVKVLAADASEQGQASAAELGQVAIDIGADKIDPATVEVTPAATLENAEGIARERGNREAVISAGGGLLKGLLDATPWGGLLGGLAAGAWAIWKKGQVQKVATALSAAYSAVRAKKYHDGLTTELLDAVGASKSVADDIRALAASVKVKKA